MYYYHLKAFFKEEVNLRLVRKDLAAASNPLWIVGRLRFSLRSARSDSSLVVSRYLK